METSAAVSKVLDIDNYLVWSVQVRTYLIAQDLWNIVEATDEHCEQENDDEAASKAWTKKNAMALHVIQISCLPRICFAIGLITSAKIAWETLEEICSLPKSRYSASDKESYVAWSIRMEIYLMELNLWNIIEAATKPPTPKDGEIAFNAWSKKNSVALYLIRESFRSVALPLIGKISMAKITWDTLAEKYKPKSTDLDVFSVLAKDNYVAWCDRMKTYLMKHDLWDIVKATTEPPTPEGDGIAFTAWSKKNSLALDLIQTSCGPDILSEIRNTSTAKLAWDTLVEKYKLKKIEDNRQYVSFQKDVQEGNWDAANQFLSSYPEAVSAQISFYGDMALHIAIHSGHMNIVKLLVNKMSEENLKIKNNDDNTVLGSCARFGNIEMAKCIIGKSQTLLSIGNSTSQLIPVVLAIKNNPSAMDMVRYLYSETPLEDLMPGKGVNGATLISQAIFARLFDMALDLLQRYPALAFAQDADNQAPIVALASVSFAYPSGNRLIFWKQWIYNSIRIPSAYATNEIPISIRKSENGERGQLRSIGSAPGFALTLLKLLGINEINELKLLHHQSKKLLLLMCERLPTRNKQEVSFVSTAIIRAVKKGMVEFVSAILNADQRFTWTNDRRTFTSIYMSSVIHRQNEVFRVLCESRLKNAMSRVNIDGNNILHMTATLEPSARLNTVPGAAFLMQREVQWFKKVESIVQPYFLEALNKDGLTPRELFRKNHKDLVKEGEKWIKETATSCTVAGALIVTIMFAVAITVPGGNNQNTGLPMFINEKLFILFIISDALSLLSASTSLLMFIGILTARYAEEDFLKSLPNKMIIGLSTLILSIASMMTTFCASLFIILPGKSRMVIPLVCLAGVPVVVFAWMQFGLLIDMVISTYKPGILDKKVKQL